MSRVAAIDCGTNSLRLLVADVVDGRLTDVARELEVVRLGQGVDRTGILAAEAIERTRAVLARYAAQLASLGAEAVRMVATSATRDAANREDFTRMVRETLGAEPDVVSGEAEARLSYAGAMSVLDADLAGARPVVADIGGGSTELVRATPTGLAAHSMQVGCVRLTERHLHDDPPSAGQVAAVVSDVRAALAAADVPLVGAPLVGVAGTVTTVAGIALELPAYDSALIDGVRLSRQRVAAVTDELISMPRADRAALPVMHPGRVDVIVAGALVLRTLLEATDARELVVSEHDILDGIALELAGS